MLMAYLICWTGASIMLCDLLIGGAMDVTVSSESLVSEGSSYTRIQLSAI